MEKRKIDVSKDELEKVEKEIISKFGTKEQFMQVLKSNGVNYSKFEQDLEEEIKLKKFVDSIAMVSIGESEAKKYYNENQDKFKYPERVRASHILISANPEQIKAKLHEENKDLRLDENITRAEVAQLVNFFTFRAPAETNSRTTSKFTDVNRYHELFGDIIEATRATHDYSYTEDGTEKAE